MLSPDNETPAEVEPTEPVTPEAEPPAEEPEGEPSEADSEAPGPEGEEPEDDGDEEPETGEPEAKKRRDTGWRRRQNRIERLERQNQILAEQLARQVPAAAPAAQGSPGAAQTPEDKAAEYVRGVVRQEREQWDAQQRQQTAVSDFQRRAAEVRAKHPDFDEVVASVSHIYVPPVLTETLLTSEHGPAIMYQLAENPVELARIAALPPISAVREVGRLEAKFVSATPSAKAGAAPQRPAAPAPITPVTARGPTRVKRPEDMTYDEYSAWRDSQRKR